MRDALICSGIVLVLCSMTFLWGRRTAHERYIDRVDTLVVYKPKVVREPVLLTSRITEWRWCSFPDSVVVREHDTTYVSLPFEQKIYGNDHYTAWVSGYRPSLDSLRWEDRTAYITETQTVTKKTFRKWDFGIQAGYGIVVPYGSASPKLGGYLGAGVTWRPF